MIRTAARIGLSRAFSPLTIVPCSRAWLNLSGACPRGGATMAGRRGGVVRFVGRSSTPLPWSSCLLSTNGLRGITHDCASAVAARAARSGDLSLSVPRSVVAACVARALVVLGSHVVVNSSAAATTTNTSPSGTWGRRWLSSSSKKSDKAKGKSKAGGGNETAAAAAAASGTSPPTQHEDWVAFQRSISVQGFETGQTTEVARRSKRGGKLVRRKQQKLRERDMDDPTDPRRFTDLAGGEFPPFRYSEEETQRLLAQAYANLPERAGKRGTRNLKRQGRRWFLVRKVRKLYKYHMANFQDRKMAKRSEKVRLVKEALREAPATRLSDRQYQAQVFAKWSARMEQQRRVGTEGGP